MYSNYDNEWDRAEEPRDARASLYDERVFQAYDKDGEVAVYRRRRRRSRSGMPTVRCDGNIVAEWVARPEVWFNAISKTTPIAKPSEVPPDHLALNSRRAVYIASVALSGRPLADPCRSRKFTDQLQAFCELADRPATQHDADAMLFLMERPTDWTVCGRQAVSTQCEAGDTQETLEAASEEEFETIHSTFRPRPVYDG
jgi:hypothetical protein